MKSNITIPDSDLKEVLGSFKKTGTNQYVSNCPFCTKEGHFYINRTTQLFDCKKCGEEGNIIKLLKLTGKLFLIGKFKSIDRTKIKSLINEEDEDDLEIDLSPKERKLPFGFKRVYSDDYWENRGFDENDFKKYKIGNCSMVSKFKGYSIISVEEDGKCVGYISRIKKSKYEIQEIEKKLDRKVLRYINDKGAKFSNLLLGIDEVNSNTDTVILLEGFPDKVTLDKTLELDNSDEIKCCCTFGKKISLSQLLKLVNKGVRKIILIFDFDAVAEMKKYGSELLEFFDEVLIGFTYDKDINDSSPDEIFGLFENLKTPSEFKRKIVKYL
jgi:hypothetical protein